MTRRNSSGILCPQGTGTQGTGTQGTGTQGTATQGTATQGTATQGTGTQGTGTQGTATQGTATQGTATQGVQNTWNGNTGHRNAVASRSTPQSIIIARPKKPDSILSSSMIAAIFCGVDDAARLSDGFLIPHSRTFINRSLSSIFCL